MRASPEITKSSELHVTATLQTMQGRFVLLVLTASMRLVSGSKISRRTRSRPLAALFPVVALQFPAYSKSLAAIGSVNRLPGVFVKEITVNPDPRFASPTILAVIDVATVKNHPEKNPYTTENAINSLQILPQGSHPSDHLQIQ